MKRFTESEPENRDGRATRIGKIYGEAAKLQARFSMRWGLDQNDLQHMDELQEQLISEIQDIAPENGGDKLVHGSGGISQLRAE